MSSATLTNTCSACGAEESLDALLLRMIDDDQVRRLIADVLTASLPLGGLVVRYLRLHKPPKQRLRLAIVAKLLAELVPDLQRGVIERTGRSWAVDGDGWKAALQAVFDAHDKGTLTLPLQGNGYLYQVLMRLADKSEAVAEKQTEQTRRAAPRQDTVQVRGQTMTIGEGLQVVYAGRDSALVRLDAAATKAVPMPESVKAYRAQLPKHKGGQP